MNPDKLSLESFPYQHDRQMRNLILLLFPFILFSCSTDKNEIYEWRGEDRTGIYYETNLLKEWPENGPEENRARLRWTLLLVLLFSQASSFIFPVRLTAWPSYTALILRERNNGRLN